MSDVRTSLWCLCLSKWSDSNGVCICKCVYMYMFTCGQKAQTIEKATFSQGTSGTGTLSERDSSAGGMLVIERLSAGRSSFERTSDNYRFSKGTPSLGRTSDICSFSNGGPSRGRTSDFVRISVGGSLTCVNLGTGRFSNGGPSRGTLLDIVSLSNGSSSFRRTIRKTWRGLEDFGYVDLCYISNHPEQHWCKVT